MQFINKFLVDFLFKANEAAMQNFKLGFVAGVIVFAILAILVRLLIMYITRGDQRSEGIKLPGQNGNIMISASAVSDLVRGIGNEIKHIEVSKVKLLKNKANELYLEVHLVMDGTDTLFGELSAEFQRKILNGIKEKFGSECVKSVEVYLDKIVSYKHS